MLHLSSMVVYVLTILWQLRYWIGYCFLVLMLVGCSYVPQENLQAHAKTSEFIEAIAQNQHATAFAILSQDAQSQIDYTRFASTKSDFRGVVDSFRHAGITTRSGEELSVYVDSLDGQEGVLTFVMLWKDDSWSIANIIEE